MIHQWQAVCLQALLLLHLQLFAFSSSSSPKIEVIKVSDLRNSARSLLSVSAGSDNTDFGCSDDINICHIECDVANGCDNLNIVCPFNPSTPDSCLECQITCIASACNNVVINSSHCDNVVIHAHHVGSLVSSVVHAPGLNVPNSVTSSSHKNLTILTTVDEPPWRNVENTSFLGSEFVSNMMEMHCKDLDCFHLEFRLFLHSVLTLHADYYSWYRYNTYFLYENSSLRMLANGSSLNKNGDFRYSFIHAFNDSKVEFEGKNNGDFRQNNVLLYHNSQLFVNIEDEGSKFEDNNITHFNDGTDRFLDDARIYVCAAREAEVRDNGIVCPQNGPFSLHTPCMFDYDDSVVVDSNQIYATRGLERDVELTVPNDVYPYSSSSNADTIHCDGTYSTSCDIWNRGTYASCACHIQIDTTAGPTDAPTSLPSMQPSNSPSNSPTSFPTSSPTLSPTWRPSDLPSQTPSDAPTLGPSNIPTTSPTQKPSDTPSNAPTSLPTSAPTLKPTLFPSEGPSDVPSNRPTQFPTRVPSLVPTGPPAAASASTTTFFTPISTNLQDLEVSTRATDAIDATGLPGVLTTFLSGEVTSSSATADPNHLETTASTGTGPGRDDEDSKDSSDDIEDIENFEDIEDIEVISNTPEVVDELETYENVSQTSVLTIVLVMGCLCLGFVACILLVTVIIQCKAHKRRLRVNKLHLNQTSGASAASGEDANNNGTRGRVISDVEINYDSDYDDDPPGRPNIPNMPNYASYGNLSNQLKQLSQLSQMSQMSQMGQNNNLGLPKLHLTESAQSVSSQNSPHGVPPSLGVLGMQSIPSHSFHSAQSGHSRLSVMSLSGGASVVSPSAAGSKETPRGGVADALGPNLMPEGAVEPTGSVVESAEHERHVRNMRNMHKMDGLNGVNGVNAQQGRFNFNVQLSDLHNSFGSLSPKIMRTVSGNISNEIIIVDTDEFDEKMHENDRNNVYNSNQNNFYNNNYNNSYNNNNVVNGYDAQMGMNNVYSADLLKILDAKRVDASGNVVFEKDQIEGRVGWNNNEMNSMPGHGVSGAYASGTSGAGTEDEMRGQESDFVSDREQSVEVSAGVVDVGANSGARGVSGAGGMETDRGGDDVRIHRFGNKDGSFGEYLKNEAFISEDVIMNDIANDMQTKR